VDIATPAEEVWRLYADDATVVGAKALDEANDAAMNRRDFLLFRTDGRLETAELSCERLYMRWVGVKTLAEAPEQPEEELGEPAARFDTPTAAQLFDDLASELQAIDVLRITHTEWLAADDFRREVDRVAAAVRARGGRVDFV
jgi:hypothetical protein